MADTWPETLPQAFLTSSYSETEAQNNLLETPEVAIPKSRPLSTTAVRSVSGVLKVSLTQLQTLRTFGRTTLVQWSLPFWFPAHSGESDAENPGYWLVKVRKDGVPEASMIRANLFNVSLGLYILP
jgi:hypothetical protein